MTRRIVRAVFQLGALTVIVLIFVLILDSRISVLPASIHNHLPVHHEGLKITDITVKECSTINPFSTCKLNPNEWHRIDKDLYLGKGMLSAAYIHTKRKTEEDLTADDKVVLDAKVSRINPGESIKPQKGEQWEKRPAGLWVLRSARRHESDSKRAVTAVDAIFGSDAVEARLGWTRVTRPLQLDNAGTPFEVHLTLRHGVAKKPERPVLRIRRDGKFKIMQAADLHLSTGPGACRDVLVDGKEDKNCEADTRTFAFVNRMLDEEKPDLVVLTGDQVNGETAPDVSSAIFKYADVFISRRIPYATIFGNHDDQGPLTRSQSMSIIESLPYSLSQYGPTAIAGIGNYVVEVLAPGSSTYSALTLYLLDTHGVSPNERAHPGYAWLKPDQIDWFSSKAKALRARHDRYSKIHMDMAFIHIPLPEYRDYDNGPKIVGSKRETVTAPTLNTGFRDALAEAGVLAVSCGHDHVNDYCALERSKPRDAPPVVGAAKGQPKQPQSEPKKPGQPELWMCYGGGAGFGGYGGHGGYTRRMRFFEVDANSARIVTYKRLESGEGKDKRLDEQLLAYSGHAVAWP